VIAPVESAGKTVLQQCNIPMVDAKTLNAMDHGYGMGGWFDYKTWTVNLKDSPTDELSDFPTFVDAVSVVYHELRHAEQFFRMAHYMLAAVTTKEAWRQSHWYVRVREEKKKLAPCPHCEAVGELGDYCSQCGKKIEKQKIGGAYRTLKANLKYLRGPWAKYLLVQNVLNVPATKNIGWNAQYYAMRGMPEINADNLFSWYNSIFGMGAAGRALAVDSVLKEGSNSNLYRTYKELPEEVDAYHVQAQLKALICELIPGKWTYDVEADKWVEKKKKKITTVPLEVE
jgi:hypothetical protein